MKRIRYYDDDFESQDGKVVETNGNLTLVTDDETGEESWRAPFEIEGE